MMVLKNPGTYLSDTRFYRKSRNEDRKAWKFSREHIEDLRDVAQGVEESNVGVCCRYLIDTRSGIGSDYDEVALDILEKFCDDNEFLHEHILSDPKVGSWRKRINRARRTIRRLHEQNQHKTVAILFIVYGHPDPLITTFPSEVLLRLGQYASLARYTDIVEIKRQELARNLAAKMPCETPKMKYEAMSIIEAALALNAEAAFQRSEAVRHGYPVVNGQALMELFRQRDRFDWALKNISSMDALREIFAPTPERFPKESPQHYLERKENAEQKRDFIVTNIYSEAKSMLDEASSLYHKAWLSSRV